MRVFPTRTFISITTALAVGCGTLIAVPSALGAPTMVEAATEDSPYTHLKATINTDTENAAKKLATLLPEATTLKNEYGYDAAFEAVNRIDEAQRLIKSIRQGLADLPAKETDAGVEQLRDLRRDALTLSERIKSAEYDIDLAKEIRDSVKDDPFSCPNAIDEGDASGSSTGSSTSGIFNWFGNRIVYDDAGIAHCKSNFEFYTLKFTKFVSIVGSFIGLVGTLAKLFRPAPPRPTSTTKPTTPPVANKG